VDLDLRLVRYVVAVADELHFGRAAHALHISQPALSKQIRRLEDGLGFRLFERDSRHVVLTADGVRFLRDARVLLAQATRMTSREHTGIRVAHIFDLDTSRIVVDEFSRRHADVPVHASQMDSRRQFDALVRGLLDVAIIRLTPAMRAAHRDGWQQRPLRLEPFWLVARRQGRARMVSLHERPVEVFGDAPGSALFNAHGEYLEAFESSAGLRLRWLGNPGTFDLCLSRLLRDDGDAHLLEFDSYAQRYRKLGMSIHVPEEVQPVYPWSIVWRDGPPTEELADFLEIANEQSRVRSWLRPDLSGPLWQPADGLVPHGS
jgi:DNA-binding transcriptional LysR family regulator